MNAHVFFTVAPLCRDRLIAFNLRKGLIPADVSALFCYLNPSFGLLKQICKHLKSELWRQVRRFKDRLIVLCYAVDPARLAAVKLRSVLLYGAKGTELWWTHSLEEALCSPKKSKNKKESGLLVLGDVTVPDNVASLLKKGPKFSEQQCMPTYELLAAYRRVSRRV